MCFHHEKIGTFHHFLGVEHVNFITPMMNYDIKKCCKHVTSLNIPEDVWPYRDIEEDFYHFNSQGYRTYEWVNVASKYDLTIGCCCVEGVGVRKQEHWTTLYEQNTNRQIGEFRQGRSGGHHISITLSWPGYSILL